MRRLPVLALLLIVAPLHAQEPPPTLDADAVDALAKQALADWKLPGFSVAVVRGDQTFARGYGVRELGKPDSIDADTLFSIASCSKAFCTFAVAQLVADGKLAWDDPAQKYLPALELYDPYVSAKLTVRDLVTHRSGLGTFGGDLLWYRTHYGRPELLARLKHLKPVAGFRERFGYQNNLYTAAGEIVPVVSGTGYDDHIAKRVLEPLGMTRTTTHFAKWQADANRATPHGEFADGFHAVAPLSADAVAAAAGVNTCATDIAKWLRMHLNGGVHDGKPLLKPERHRELWQAVTPLPARGSPADKRPTHLRAYALGWFVSDFHGRLRVEHSGSLDGMLSMVALLPEEKFAVAVFTNSDTAFAAALCNTLLDRAVGAKPTDHLAQSLTRAKAARAAKEGEWAKQQKDRHADAPPGRPLAEYAATYTSKLYGGVTVKHTDGKLTLTLDPAPTLTATLEPWHHETFRVKWKERNPYIPDGWATFVLDRVGKPTELRIDCPNDDFDFTELELRR